MKAGDLVKVNSPGHRCHEQLCVITELYNVRAAPTMDVAYVFFMNGDGRSIYIKWLEVVDASR
jgi:hypothetical protein